MFYTDQSRFSTLSLVVVFFLFSLGLTIARSSSSTTEVKPPLADRLQVAYELADCDSEVAIGRALADASATVTSAFVAETTECQRVSACAFDASQNDNASSYCDPDPLTIGANGTANMHVGVIGDGWMIPPGATILSADIQFTAAENSVRSAAFTVYGIAEDNAAPFSPAADVQSRVKTASSASWTPGTWTAGDAGTAQKTTDLTAIVQEIVNRPGYVMGNNLGFVITGSGRRIAESFDTDPALAPEICITYDVPEPPSVFCTECPSVSISSLDGVPNFPSVNELNVCSVPDTVSLFIYNNGACPINNVQVTVNFDSGLAYGGFVENNEGTGGVAELDVTDGSNPVFLITEIDSAGVFIINFGMTADCDIDLESEEEVNFNVVADFSYDLESGGTATCSAGIDEVGSYGGGIKVPVLNALSITEEEVEISSSNDQECQTILVSQDGLDSKLSDFMMEINGLDFDNYQLGDISINGILASTGVTVDMTAGQVLVAIDGQYFGPNFGPTANGDDVFDVFEDLNVEVCYFVTGCTDEPMFVSYDFYYGCNGKECFDRTAQDGAVNFLPNFGSSVVASSGNITEGGICGADLSYDITIMSGNSDPLDGLWQDLVVKYGACLGNGMNISGLMVNGVMLDAALWSTTGSALTIDFSTNTNPAYGLTDEDGGGVLNDLAGGQSLTFTTMIDIGCSDSMSSCDGDLGCFLDRVEVNGKRNCGQDFQTNGIFSPPVDFNYGEVASSDNTMIISPYSIPIAEVVRTTANVWDAGLEGFRYGYEFGFNNITPCASPGGIKLVANIVAAGNRINNIRYLANSATYQGMAVPGTTAEYEIIDLGGGLTDTIGLNITIPAGDPNVSLHDYFFNLEYLGDCFVNDYMFVTYKVVEECNGCGVDPCEIVRSCGNAANYVIWNGTPPCPCVMEGATTDYYRTNYGYADKEMTQKLTKDDVPRADQIRLLPGDTLFRSAEFTINDIDELRKADQRWIIRFDSDNQSPATPLIHDANHAQFLGWYWVDGVTGVKTEIGVPTCIQNYPHATRDNWAYPGIWLRNFGVENYSTSINQEANGGGPANDYGICKSDPQINPNYPPEIVNYEMVNMSSTDYAADRMRFSIWFQRPPNCGLTQASQALPGSTDHINPCFDEFFQQFPLKNGDKIVVDIMTPMIHNPAYDLQAINGTSYAAVPSLWIDFIGYSTDEATCATTPIFTDCSELAPIQEHLPGPVSITNNVVVEDCDTEVNYTFTLNNPVPTDLATGELPWFENEYRPYFATEYLQFEFPNNMVYLGDGVIIMPDGTEVTFPAQYIQDSEGNLACIDDGSGGVCCVAANTDTLAAMKLVDEQYLEGLSTAYGYGPDGPNESGNYCDVPALVHHKGDPFPHLMVGGTEQCTYGIRYSLSSLCPEDIESTDFRLDYQFAEPYIPTLAHQRANSYFGNESTATRDYTNTSYYYLFPDNPFGESCSAAPDEGCNWYFQKITTDPDASDHTINPMRQGGYLITTPQNFTDNSQNFPPLIPTLDQLLIADLEGANEVVNYMVCAEVNGVDMGTNTNIVTSITLPASVDFIDAQDPTTGTSLAWVLQNTNATSSTYTVESPDLAPGECASIQLVTELLFCPVGTDFDTETCFTTTAGCIEPAKAALFSAEGGACDQVSACFMYVSEESELQAKWDSLPSMEIPLCSTFEMATVLNNVRPATLTGIGTDWWFPNGIDFVTGSWQVCYPAGGPGPDGPCYTIPDPTADPASNNALGSNYEYDDDVIWSGVIPGDPMNTVGFVGVGSDLDSAFVQFKFEVETVCDEFVSGTAIHFQGTGSDPCEGTVESMFVPSSPIIIEGANPADFPQFFVFADPLTANCGVESQMTLTYLNISPLGVTDNTMVCMDIETSTFDYVPGSVTFISPVGHVPTFSESTNGAITHICFDVPDGIGPGEAFQTGFSFTVPTDVSCGDEQLGVQVSSEIMNANCMALGIECSVDVLNSVNPLIDVQFLPPVTVEDQSLTVGCGNGDGTVPMCYSGDLFNNGDFYTNDVKVVLIRDVDSNGQIDDYDIKLDSMTHSVVIANGETFVVDGCFDVPESQACPVFLMFMQETNCVCDSEDFYYDSIEPDVVGDLGTEFALCPMTPFGLAYCGDWTYDVSPAAGGSLVQNTAGDSLYLTLNEGFGIDSPVKLIVSSQTGGCQPFDFEIDLYSLADFMPGPYAVTEACDAGCTTLDLDIPAEYVNTVTVTWSPTTFLDDPTSFTPTICNPTSSLTYTVDFEFMTAEGMCSFQAFYPINVQPQPISPLFDQGNLCNSAQATFTGPAGFSNYNWIRIAPDGTETPAQAGSSDTFTATEEGEYYLEYYNTGDVCTSESTPFEVAACIELSKTLADISPTSNPNEYTVVYDIEVSHPGTITTSYDLFDEPGFDTDIVASTASYTSDAPGVLGGGLLLPAPATPGWSLGDDVSIDGGDVHTYSISYLVTIDLEDGMTGDDMYTACGQGSGPANAVPGEGLFNNASLDLDDDPTTPEVEDSDCGELPYLELEKGHISTVLTGDNCYDVTYYIKVSNIGGAEGQYDLIDDPDFDDDFTYESALFTTDAIGNPGGSLPTSTSTYVLANDQVIAASKVDSFTIVIGVCIDLEDPASVGDETYVGCSTATPGDPTNGEGLFNEAFLDTNNDGTIDQQAEACDDVPYLVLEKTFGSMTVLPDGTADVVFNITVQNLGVTDELYDLYDLPQYDDDVVINTAAYSSDVPSMGTLPTTVAGAPGWLIGDDVIITAGSLHTYMLTVNVSVELGDAIGDNTYAACGDSGNADGVPGEGLFNTAGLDIDADGTVELEDTECADVMIVDVALTKAVVTPGPYAYGDVIEFDIEVYNQGNVPLYNVLVTDAPGCGYVYDSGSQPWGPAGAYYETTLAGPIAPNTTQIVKIFYEVVPCTDNTSNAYLNVAEVTSMQDQDGNDITDEDIDSTGDDDPTNDGGGAVDTDTDGVVDGDGTGDPGDEDAATDEDDSDPAQIEIFDLALTKVLDTAGPYAYGDEVTFTIEVTNQGNVTATNILVTDYVPSGYAYVSGMPAWSPAGDYYETTIAGPLAPGLSTTVSITLEIVMDNTDGAGSYTNIAEITSASDGEGNPTVDVDSTPDDDPTNDPGGALDSDSDDTIDGDGSGDPGDTDAGTDEDDADPAGVEIFDLALIKTTTAMGPFSYGDMITFNIEVVNQGSATATDVQVIDYIPCGYSFASMNFPLWTFDAADNEATSTISGPILAGETVIVPLTLIVQPCAEPDAWLNFSEIFGANDVDGNPATDIDSTPDDTNGNDAGGEADTASDDQLDGNGTDDEDDHDPELIEIFDLALTKSTVTPGPYAYGDAVVFEIEVFNQGNLDATNITVVDYVPSGFTYDPAATLNVNNGWGPGANPTTTIAGPLAPLTSTTVQIELIINANPQGDEAYLNVAEISSADGGVDADSDPDSDPTDDAGGEPGSDSDDSIDGDGTGDPGDVDAETDEDDSDPAIIEIFDLALTKTTTATGPFSYGEVITFDIEVTNQGTVPATTIEVVDYIPCGYEFAATNSPIWNFDAADSEASAVIAGPLAPGASMVLSIELEVIACTSPDAWLNYAEIFSANDDEGNPAMDVDSTPDGDPTNDPGGEPDGDSDNENEGDGSGPVGGGDASGDEDDHDPELIEIFDLALTKSVTTPPVAYGDYVIYSFIVYNQGNVAASDIVVNDYNPAGLVYDPLHPINVANGWGAGPDPATTIAGPLQPGANASVQLALIYTNTGGGAEDWVNVGEIGSANGPDGNPGEDADSTPDNDPDNDNEVNPGDPDDGNVDGGGPDVGEDEDDSDPAGLFDVVDVALRKTTSAVAPFVVGDIVRFDIEVFNQGNVTVQNVKVIDYIPCGFTYSNSNFPLWIPNPDGTSAVTEVSGPIAPGNSLTVSIDLIVAYCDDYADAWTNNAEIYNFEDDNGNDITNQDVDSNGDIVDGNDIGGTPNSDEDDHIDDDGTDINGDGITDEDDHDPEMIEIYDLALIKEIVTPGPYAYGDQIEFQITVFNQGNQDAYDVEVTDYIPAGYAYDAAANTSWSGTYPTVTTVIPGPIVPDGSSTVSIFLEIQQTTGGETDWFNYSEITQSFNEDGEDVTDFDWDSEAGSNGPGENGVEPGDAGDNDTDSHDIGGNEDDHDPAGIEIYDLAQIKTTAATGPFSYGDVVTYDITVYNQGSIASSGIEITDYLPCGLAYNASNDASGWSYDAATGEAVITIPGVLAPGESAIVSIDVTVQQCIDMDAGSFTNITEITNSVSEDPDEPADDIDSTEDDDPTDDPTVDDELDNNGGDEDDHDPETIEIFDLAQIKTLVTPAPYAYGDLLEFEFTVCNQGNVDAQSIEVTDYLPLGYGFDAAANMGWTQEGADVVYAVPSILVADACTNFSLFLTIEQTEGGQEDWINYSEITNADDDDDPTNMGPEDADSNPGSDGPGENGVQPGDDADDNLDSTDEGGEEDDHDPAGIEIYDLAQRKASTTPGPYSYGDVINYEIEVHNQGSVTATDVEITDYLPCGLSYLMTNNVNGWSLEGSDAVRTIGSIEPGEIVTITIDLELVQCLDMDESSFTNFSEISGGIDEETGEDGDDIDSNTDDDPDNDVGGTPNTDEDDETGDDGMDGDGDGVTDEDDSDPDRIEVFDLAQIKTLVTPAPYVYGDVLEFEFTVCNQGNVDAQSIEVTDYLPAGYGFDASANMGWTQSGSDVVYAVPGILAADACTSFSLFVTFQMTTGGQEDWINYSEITSADDDDDPTNMAPEDADSNPGSDGPGENGVQPGDDADDDLDSTDEGGEEDDHDPAGIEVFDLAQIKQETSSGPYVYGDVVTFDLTVFNQGSIPATEVELTDYIPCGYLFEASNNPNWSYDGSAATITIAGPIMPGLSMTRTISLTVQPCDDADAWVNFSEISEATNGDTGEPGDDVDSDSDDDPTNDGPSDDDETDGDPNDPNNPDEDDSDPEEIEVFDLALIKFIDDKGPYGPGDNADYVIKVYNQGNVPAYNVEVTDYLNEGYIFNQGDNADWMLTGDLLTTIVAGPLAPGDSVTLSLVLEVTVPEGASIASWYNEAEISDADDDLDPDNDDPVDADSDADQDPDNDNDLVDGPDDDPIFDEEDDNDNEINENPNDPFGNGDDDEDDNDAADILVVGGLGDTVFKDLDGDGIQDPNEPGVQGVVVTLTDCMGNVIAMQTTDANGFYFFNNLIPGDYQISFDISNLPEGCAFTQQDQGGDDALDSDVDLNGVAPCTNIQGGEYDSTFDAGLLVLVNIGDFVWHDLDGDGVQDPGEPGIGGVDVFLFDGDGNILEMTTTDADGYYLFENLYPGDYYIAFDDPDGFELTFADNGGDLVDSDVTNSINSPFGSTTDIFTIEYGQDDDLSFDAGYYMCIPIGQYVWYDVDEDDIRDFTENGINGLQVNLFRRVNGRFELWDTYTTGLQPNTPSTDGYFKFCAPPGEYYLSIDLPPYGLVPANENVFGFVPLNTSGEQVTDSDLDRNGRSDNFTVRSGDDVCTIGAGYYPMATAGNLVWFDANSNGRQDQSEPTVPDVIVELIDMTTSEVVEQTVTNNAGIYGFEQLQARDYYMRFHPPSGYTFTTPNNGDEMSDSDVDNSNGARTTAARTFVPGGDNPNIDAGLVAGVLPVEWLDFTARALDDGTHLLSWATAQELNASHFEVERSLNGESWSTLGEVDAIGNSTQAQWYNFESADTETAGLYTYRIKQLDLDGSYDYSIERNLEVEQEKGFDVYPNPTSGNITIDYYVTGGGEVSVDILDITGSLLRTQVIVEDAQSGFYTESLDLAMYPPGIYTVRVNLPTESLHTNVIVVK